MSMIDIHWCTRKQVQPLSSEERLSREKPSTANIVMIRLADCRRKQNIVVLYALRHSFIENVIDKTKTKVSSIMAAMRVLELSSTPDPQPFSRLRV